MDENLTINLALTIAAPVERVWHVLTDAEELSEWLCDADIILHAGRYELFGDRLPDAPQQSPTRLVKSDPLKCLSFAWQLRGADTVVEVNLEALGGEACELRVKHSGVIKRPDGHSGTTDFWVVALENLRLYVLGKEPVRYDFTQRDARVKLVVDVDAPAADLYGALLSPEALDEFWSNGATIEPTVDGKYDYGWGSGGPTKIFELEADHKLVTDWHYKGEPDTIVTWQLDGSGGRTRLTLVHTGFDPETNREDYRHGWLGMLVPLKARAELGEKWSRVRTDGYKAEGPG
jgi:uncharacterized protein YndB with AHSA1/START domain